MVALERRDPGAANVRVATAPSQSIASGRHGYQPDRKRTVAAMLGMTPVAVGMVLAFLPWRGVVTARPVTPPITVTLLPLPAPPRAEPMPVRHPQTTAAPARPIIARALQTSTPPLVPAPLVPAPPTIAAAPSMPAPPVASPAPAAAPASPPARSAGKDSWEARVVARLESLKRFPPAARSRRDQGVASVRFRINRAGMLLSSSLVSGSGTRLLDQEALATVARAQPYPPIPASRPDEVELVVPIEFFLGNRRP